MHAPLVLSQYRTVRYRPRQTATCQAIQELSSDSYVRVLERSLTDDSVPTSNFKPLEQMRLRLVASLNEDEICSSFGNSQRVRQLQLRGISYDEEH